MQCIDFTSVVTIFRLEFDRSVLTMLYFFGFSFYFILFKINIFRKRDIAIYSIYIELVRLYAGLYKT